MRNTRTIVAATLAAVVVLAVAVLCALGWSANEALHGPVTLEGEQLHYELEPGTSLGALAGDLAALGVIDSPRWVTWYGRLSGGAESLQSGEYLIEPGMTPVQLLARIRAGEVVQHAITFVEGWTFARWRQELAAQEWLRQELAAIPDGEVADLLGLPGEHPEGRFFPDTYHFPRGTSDRRVLEVAAERMAAILAREWALRDPAVQLSDPYEALILASLVEKESGVAEDRAKIAAVFLRRLARGLRLQSDPTVIYGMGDAFDGDLRRSDLERPTPYNTYVRFGMPPTPICNPGRAAIQAALHPAPGSSLYFVAKGDGSSHFSDTLEEHNRAVKQYQVDARAADYRSSPRAEAAGDANGRSEQ